MGVQCEGRRRSSESSSAAFSSPAMEGSLKVGGETGGGWWGAQVPAPRLLRPWRRIICFEHEGHATSSRQGASPRASRGAGLADVGLRFSVGLATFVSLHRATPSLLAPSRHRLPLPQATRADTAGAVTVVKTKSSLPPPRRRAGDGPAAPAGESCSPPASLCVTALPQQCSTPLPFPPAPVSRPPRVLPYKI